MHGRDYRCPPRPRQPGDSGMRISDCGLREDEWRRASHPSQIRNPHSAVPSRPEALTVLDGGDERLDHLGVDEVAVELVELREPEVIAVEVRVRRLVRRAPQIP